MLHIRKIEQTEHDLEFLSDMIYESIHIPENKPPKEELLKSPQIKKYNEGWGRKGDSAVIVFNEDNCPIGAAWYRLFTKNENCFGYVDENTPELGIAIINEGRGKGKGTLLMEKLFKIAASEGYKSLSLSVDPKNTKDVQLYKKLGFVKCGTSGTSWTMVYDISSS